MARAARKDSTPPSGAPAEENRRRSEDVPQDEKSFVKVLLDRVDEAKKRTRIYREELLPLFRGYAWGTRFQENELGSNAPVTYRNTRTNLCYATIATLLPHIYAKNPEISVSPTEAVSEEQYERAKEFAQTAQTLIARMFVKEAKLKPRAKQNVRSAMATGIGWLKLGFQESLTGDPVILQRHNDLQDNLQRIEHLIVKSRSETDMTRLQEEREELRQQMDTVRSGSEVQIYKGFVLDRVLSEDILILDEKIREFDAYDDADAIAHGIWFTTDQYEQQFHYKPETGVTEYSGGELAKTSMSEETDGEKPKGPYIRVWEIWDKKAGKVYTAAEGGVGYCRPPFVPVSPPKRWYPFYGLAFNQVEGRLRPIADIELLYQLQDEYNVTRYFYAEARKESVPVRVFRKTGELSEEDINNLKNRRARQWVGVQGNPQVPLRDDIMQLEPFKVAPEAFDVTIIRNDMDMLVGLSDASRANLIEAKTATEAEIMRQALQSRAAERQDTHEDLLSDMSEAVLQIMLQRFTLDEVKQVAGEKSVWPTDMGLEDIYKLVEVSVRAGSTGKPDASRDREQWSIIMPILKDTAAQVAELRAQGQDEMGDSLVELLKETLKRYDERIDIDRFIPRPKIDPQTGQPENQAKRAQQMQQMAMQNQQLQEALQKCQQDLQRAQTQEQSRMADAQAKQAIEVAKESSRAAESQKQAQVEAAGAIAKEVEETKRHEREMSARAQEHEHELECREREAMIKVAGDLMIERMKTQQAQNDAAKVKGEYDAILSQLADMLSTLAGDVVADYDESEEGTGAMTGVTQEPAELLGTDPMEKLVQALQLLRRPLVPEMGEGGKLSRLSRTSAATEGEVSQ